MKKATKLQILRPEFELSPCALTQNRVPCIDNIAVALLQCASTKIKETLFHLTLYIYEKSDVPERKLHNMYMNILRSS